MNNLSALLRLFFRRLLARSAKGDPARVVALIAKQEPALARVLRDALAAAYLQSVCVTARPAVPRALSAGDAGAPPPAGWLAIAGEPPDGPVRFPAIDAAAEWLAARGLVLPDEFARLGDDAARAAFTVARSITLDAVARVRDAAVEAVRDGGTLGQFRERVADALHGSMLTPARTETLFRTHLGQAQAAGQRAVIEHPLVADEFPYLLWTATHDSRVRVSHLEMERWGQNGTAVYRRDDPMFETLWPPCEWNCRCAVVPLTIEDAAAHGSREARRWLESGAPPADPVWASRPYPIEPPDGWPTHQGVVAVA